MAGKDVVMLSQEERKRLQVIYKGVGVGAKTSRSRADAFSLSFRPVNRIVNKVRRAIAHKYRQWIIDRGYLATINMLTDIRI